MTPASSEPTVAMEPPALKPSGAIRVLWWCVMLQFALGGPAVFLLPILFLVAVGAAFVVVVDSITDRDLTLEHRLIGLLLSAAVIPAAILGIYIADAIGYFDDEPTASARVVALVATVVSVLVLLAVKPRAWKILKKNEWKP